MQNEWIRYVDRTYQQIKTRVLTEMQVLTPEITDHTESNPFVQLLSVWSGIAEMLGYYIDNAAREAHLTSARLYISGIKHAEANDYRVHSVIASTGYVVFSLDKEATSDVTIPAMSVLEGLDKQFRTVSELVIPKGTLEGRVGVKQIIPVDVSLLTPSTGKPRQIYSLVGDIEDNSVVVVIDGVTWTHVDSFSLCIPTDKVFIQTVNKNRQTIIKFGDGVNGEVPKAGAQISVRYNISDGELGNVEPNVITKVVSKIDSAGATLSVTNPENTTGGAYYESLESIKSNIPKNIRTVDRAVTEQDFVDIAELKKGVVKAGVEHSCGEPVKVYIIPEGGGLASEQLLKETQEWVEDRKIVTIGVNVLRAGEIRILLKVHLRVRPQYVRQAVIDEVRNNLMDFLSYKQQEIGGEIFLSDIYEVIERVSGVSSSDVLSMQPKPYARPVNTVKELVWTPNVTENSIKTIKWQIRMNNNTNFELLRNGALEGSYTTGSVVTVPEIVFSVTPKDYYTTGDVWEFYTYKFYGNIDIIEPAIPVSRSEDINITAEGGL